MSWKMKFLDGIPCDVDYDDRYFGYHFNETTENLEFDAELEVYKTEYIGSSATVIFKPLGNIDSKKSYRVLMNELPEIIKHCNNGVIKGHFTWIRRYGKFGIKYLKSC